MQSTPDLLDAWKRRVAISGTNLGELAQTREFARLKAKAARGTLGAASAALTRGMVEDMAALWRLWEAVRRVVEQAHAENGRSLLRASPGEVHRLLTQASVDAGTLRIDPQERGAFEAGEQRQMLTLDEAAERIEHLTARVQQGVAQARAGWDGQAHDAARLAAEAQSLLLRAEAVGEGHSMASVEAVVARIHAATQVGEDDPIGAAEAIAAVREAVGRVTHEVREAEAASAAAQAQLRAAEAAMRGLRLRRVRDEQAHARAAERIDAESGLRPLPAAIEVDNLERWLARLCGLPQGRVQAIQAGLRAWGAAMASVSALETRASEALGALLRARRDLKEQYDMLDAAASDMALASPPGPELVRARSDARRALACRPMSLAAAQAAVRAFETEVLTGRPGRAAAEAGR